MIIAGFNVLAHDAGVTILDYDGNIDFAGTSERFSGHKHDHLFTKSLMDKLSEADLKVFYENCWLPQFKDRDYPWEKWNKSVYPEEQTPQNVFEMFNRPKYMRQFLVDMVYDHHRCHAASSFYTRPWENFEDTVIMSLDGAGKDLWTSSNIYTYDADANNFVLHKSSSQSIGFNYSLVTCALGFRNFEEGTVMGLSSFGDPDIYYDEMAAMFTHNKHVIEQTQYFEADIFNAGSSKMGYDWMRTYIRRFADGDPQWKENVAAALQKVTEEQILEWAKEARKYGSKLCYAGGVAQNILANTKIRDLFDDVWIVSDPSDGGCSLGAAAWAYCGEYGGSRINWTDAYLGYNIDREVNPKEVVDYILKNKVCGIANGRAEFGPRALGNRSLIGDVRWPIKDTVNAIKRREPFRPFGPLILEEEFDNWFEGHTNGYMQYVCKPKHYLQSVIHVDGTSRVQTVPANSRSIIRPILEEYYERTGVPMLLNTSLNIKGKPMVNNWAHAEEFQNQYGVRVF